MLTEGNFICYYKHKIKHQKFQGIKYPLILALGRQIQVDICEFESSIVYKVSFVSARVT